MLRFVRGVNDDGETELAVYQEDEGKLDEGQPWLTLITQHIDGQWYGLVDYGDCDTVGPFAASALKALYAAKVAFQEGEEWAEVMLEATSQGRVKYSHTEPVERGDGVIEFQGTWEVEPKN